MKNINNLSKKLYCVPPMPIMAQAAYGLKISLTLIVPLLSLLLAIHLFRNKLNERRLLDKRTKSYVLWITTTLIFIFVFPYFKSYRELYVVNLLVLSGLLGINLFLSKKYSLFKVGKAYWFLFVIFLVGVLIISGLNLHDAYQQWQKDKTAKKKFTEILKKIPEPSKEKIKDKSWEDARTLNYKVSVDNKRELPNFYANNIQGKVCEKFKRGQFNFPDDMTFDCKESSSDKWIRLNFKPESKSVTKFTIYYYGDSRFEIKNPLGTETCGEPSLY